MLKRRRPLQALALGSVCVASLWTAPQMCSAVGRYESRAVVTPTVADLKAAGASAAAGVQCMDMFSGCIGTLYKMDIAQSTGYMYDCYLFNAPWPGQAAYRAGFLAAFEAARPRVVVMRDQFCMTGRGYDRVERWPEFADKFNAEYALKTEWQPTQMVHWWHRAELPAGYRIYVRR